MALFVSLLALAGCATIAGPRQVLVDSSPRGAAITLDCGSAPAPAAVTPASITIDTDARPCIVTLLKDGYEPAQVELHPHHLTFNGRETSGRYGLKDYVFSAQNGDLMPGEPFAAQLGALSEAVQAPSNIVITLEKQ